MPIFLDRDDPENHILVFHLQSSPFLLLVINYGTVSYNASYAVLLPPDCSSPYRLKLRSFSRSGNHTWKILFQNTNKRYDISSGDKLFDLVSTDCNTTKWVSEDTVNARPTESVVCYDLVLGYHSLALYYLV